MFTKYLDDSAYACYIDNKLLETKMKNKKASYLPQFDVYMVTLFCVSLIE